MISAGRYIASFSLVLTTFACQKSDSPTEPLPVAQVRPVVLSAPVGTGIDIFVAKADGTDPIQLTFSGNARHPSWSADSKQIAFEVFDYLQGSAPPSHDAVYVMDASGAHQRKLTNIPYQQFGPVWSPLGTEIAYNSMDGIDVVRTDGRGVRRIVTPIEFQSFISWSPDGLKFAYSCITYSTASLRKADICLINSDGTGIRRLSFFDDAHDPSWSPDGSQIVFTAKGHLFVMNADGSNTRQISLGESRNRYAPRWSSDGTRIIYGNWSSVPPFGAGLYTIGIDGTRDLPFGIQDSYSGTADWSRVDNSN